MGRLALVSVLLVIDLVPYTARLTTFQKGIRKTSGKQATVDQSEVGRRPGVNRFPMRFLEFGKRPVILAAHLDRVMAIGSPERTIAELRMVLQRLEAERLTFDELSFAQLRGIMLSRIEALTAEVRADTTVPGTPRRAA